MARKGLYTKTFTLPDGKRKYVTAKTAEELDQKVLYLRLQMQMGVDLSDNTTFGELMQIWFNTEKKGKIRETTEEHLKGMINVHIMPYLSRYRLKDITPIMIRNVMNKVSDKNIIMNRRILGVMREVFDMAVDNGLLMKSPVLSRFKVDGKSVGVREALTPDEEKQILCLSKKFKNPDVWLFILIADQTGMRHGEILGLMWDAIDFEKKTIYVHRSVEFVSKKPAELRNELKNDASERYVPMSEEVMAALKTRKASTNSLIVFHNPTGGCYGIREDSKIRYFLRVHVGPEATGKNDVTTPFPVSSHTFRHTYATRMFEAGLDIKEVQRLLGHKTPEITLKIYTHYCEQSRQANTFSKARTALNSTTSVPQAAVN